MSAKVKKIIDTSSDDEDIINNVDIPIDIPGAVDQIDTLDPIDSHVCTTNMDQVELQNEPLEQTIELLLEDESDEEIVQHIVEPTEPKEPSKKDREDAYIVAQRALRELQFELPKRKPTISLNQFLSSRGIKREQALENLNRSLVRNKKDEENIDSRIRNDIAEQAQVQKKEEVLKANHLVPLIRTTYSDSDSEIELVITDTPHFPVTSMQMNTISTAIAERNKEMIKLANQQAIQRREQEFQQKKEEVLELKRKRKERKEARLLKMQQVQKQEELLRLENLKKQQETVVDKAENESMIDSIPVKKFDVELDEMDYYNNDSGSDVDFGSLNQEQYLQNDSDKLDPSSTGLKLGNDTQEPNTKMKASDALDKLLKNSFVNPEGFKTVKGINAFALADSQEPVLNLLSGTFGSNMDVGCDDFQAQADDI